MNQPHSENLEKTGVARWDSHPAIRDAILKHMKMNIDEYMVAMGMKHHRSIDDPWETS